MSVQCKNCENGIKLGTQIKCIAWVNGGFVNNKMQRQCARYLDKTRVAKAWRKINYGIY